MKTFSILIAALTMATGVSAQTLQLAPAETRMVGTPCTTGVSGDTSLDTEVVGNPRTKYAALWGGEFGERGDRPCFIRALKERIDDPDRDFTHHELNICSNGGPTNRSRDHSHFPDYGPDGSNTFVAGVSTCLNGNATRIKGVRFYGAKLLEDGTVVRLEDWFIFSAANAAGDVNATNFLEWRAYLEAGNGYPSDYNIRALPYSEMSRANCDTPWQSVQRCPEGHLATAIVAHMGPAQTRRQIRGLALTCRLVRPALTGILQTRSE